MLPVMGMNQQAAGMYQHPAVGYGYQNAGYGAPPLGPPLGAPNPYVLYFLFIEDFSDMIEILVKAVNCTLWDKFSLCAM